MARFHKPLVSFDHRLVVRELTRAGVLYEDVQANARAFLEGRDRHTGYGPLDYKRSPYLTNWLGERSLTVIRMGAFISSPVQTPTLWHKDGPHTRCAINIPWFGTKGTYTQWAEDAALTENVVHWLDTGSIQRVEGLGYTEPAESVEMHDLSMAINTYAFHRIHPEHATEFRGILTLRFPVGFEYDQLVSSLV